MAIYIIFTGIGSFLVLFWLFLYIKYEKKYRSYIQAIQKGEYILQSTFFVGLGMIEFFHINLFGTRAKKRKKLLREIRDEQYLDFYYAVNLAGQFTYLLTFSMLGFLTAALLRQPMMALGGILLAAALAFYLDYDIDNLVQKRREQIMVDFPHMLSKLALLINAGMPLREGLEKVSSNSTGVLYEEMKMTVLHIQNGLSEYDALRILSDRCGVLSVKKFTTILMQNLQKGSSELAKSLMDISEEIWNERVNEVKRLGETASTKLLIPIMMMLGGILLMVIVPIFSSMSM